MDKVTKVYGCFNNHYHGYAVEKCIEILDMLEVAKLEHGDIKKRIIRHNIQMRSSAYEAKLEEFGFGGSELGVEDLLLRLTDEVRLERGREI